MPEIALNGYQLKDLQEQFFSKMGTFTAAEIHRRLRLTADRLNSDTTPIALSFGENCGPAEKLRGRADKLRGAECYRLGSNFFDNIVTPVTSLSSLLDADFARLFDLSRLEVGVWEGNDSVLDTRYGIYFHHYFYLRGTEKSHEREGRPRRLIDEADIPLFLPAVQAQFEYLAAKMRLVLRSQRRKVLFIRKVDGSPVDRREMSQIDAALVRFGASNTSVLAIYAVESTRDFDPGVHRYIKEEGERWGRTEEWGEAIHSVM